MAKTPVEISSLARSHSPGAIKVLAGIMNSPKASDTARVAAANSLLDRAWGKAVQKNENETTVRYVARIPNKATSSEEWQQQHEQPTLQ
jgi:hypothetical protein